MGRPELHKRQGTKARGSEDDAERSPVEHGCAPCHHSRSKQSIRTKGRKQTTAGHDFAAIRHGVALCGGNQKLWLSTHRGATHTAGELLDAYQDFANSAFPDNNALSHAVGRIAAAGDVIQVHQPLRVREQMALLKSSP